MNDLRGTGFRGEHASEQRVRVHNLYKHREVELNLRDIWFLFLPAHRTQYPAVAPRRAKRFPELTRVAALAAKTPRVYI